MPKRSDVETVMVEVLLRVDGNSEFLRVTTIELPVTGREAGSEAVPGAIQFESVVLIKTLIRKLRSLI